MMAARTRFAGSFLLVLAAFCGLPAGAEAPALDGHWQGAIVLPAGRLEIDVDLVTQDGKLAGDISIPVQNLHDYALSGVAADGGKIRFEMAGIPGQPSFEGTLSEDGAKISGPFRQGGGELTFELARAAGPAEKARLALAGLDPVLEQAVKDFNVPGLGVAVVAGGEVVYAKGFGFRDVAGQLPLTPDTLFAIGSTTKAMTATLLGMLVDDGKLEWDEPVNRYLPELRLADPMVSARLTARDLLTHRSGLPRHDLLWYNNLHDSREQLIAKLEHLELSADLRETWQYNNLAYMTAGYLAGKLSGKSWEGALRERLLDPLGMQRTVFSVDAMQRDPDHALPYKENDKGDGVELIPYRNIDLVGPAGSVDSSVNEMSRWLLFNLEGGKAGGRQLIQPATLADIRAPHMVLPQQPPPDSQLSAQTYGMGWGVEVYRGHKLIEHTGGIDGFSTLVAFLPDDGLGLVAFTNSGSGLPNPVSREITDRLLGLEKIEWLAKAKERRAAGRNVEKDASAKAETLRVKGTRPSHPLADYLGIYDHPAYGRLEIRQAPPAPAASGKKAGKTAAAPESFALIARFNDIDAPLEHWHYDIWNGAKNPGGDPTFENTKFRFETSFEGEIVSVAAPLELLAKPIVFQKQPDPKLSDPVYLQRFVGTYLAPTGQKTKIELAGDKLTLFLVGQPLFTLVPEISGRFGLKGLQGYSVGFPLDAAGKPAKIVFYQPEGVFESVRE